ncbi:hypothetical protein CDA63_02020 [Hymenobacter amundsenii]|uniref:Uncharacterized protein n=1 Tax=Hymenobacter amundsenii TaxID=2006685 RepID=A0A246FTR3_9BACT|nr:hypothetical protein [Hymenobacter amundsenii]OWP65154.1 hypothetical protein CDA63_02020 [Hymenobacter amundsenii]
MLTTVLFSRRSAAALLAGLLLAGCDGAAPGTQTPTGQAAPPFVAESGQPVGTPGADPVARQANAPAASGAPLPDSLHLLSPSQAGPLRLGLTQSRLEELVPASRLRSITYTEKGRTLPAYELVDATNSDAPVTRLYLTTAPNQGQKVLHRMLITDPQYRTAEGIGVGSPFGAARQNLGFTRLRNTPAGLAAVSGEVRLAWLIDPNSLPAGADQTLPAAAVPPAARITGVLLY